MKIIHIVSDNTTNSVRRLIDEQRNEHEIDVINLDVAEPDYDAIIDKIINSDRVISWSNIENVTVENE